MSPSLAIPTDGSLEEAGAALGVLAGEQLSVREAGVVIDRDMQVLPTDMPAPVRPPGLLTEHPLARLPETSEPLRIHVQKLARPLTLVAACAASNSRRSRQPRAAMPTQTFPIVEGGYGTRPANRTGPYAERRRATRIACSTSAHNRCGCLLGVDRRSRSAAQPPCR